MRSRLAACASRSSESPREPPGGTVTRLPPVGRNSVSLDAREDIWIGGLELARIDAPATQDGRLVVGAGGLPEARARLSLHARFALSPGTVPHRDAAHDAHVRVCGCLRLRCGR